MPDITATIGVLVDWEKQHPSLQVLEPKGTIKIYYPKQPGLKDVVESKINELIEGRVYVHVLLGGANSCDARFDLKQWGSAGTTSYRLKTVGVLLYFKTVAPDIPLDAFMPLFMQHNNFNVVSLFAVLLPLKLKLVNFDGLPLSFWLSYVAMYDFNLFIAGLILYWINSSSDWAKRRKEDKAAEQVAEDAA